MRLFFRKNKECIYLSWHSRQSGNIFLLGYFRWSTYAPGYIFTSLGDDLKDLLGRSEKVTLEEKNLFWKHFSITLWFARYLKNKVFEDYPMYEKDLEYIREILSKPDKIFWDDESYRITLLR